MPPILPAPARKNSDTNTGTLHPLFLRRHRFAGVFEVGLAYERGFELSARRASRCDRHAVESAAVRDVRKLLDGDARALGVPTGLAVRPAPHLPACAPTRRAIPSHPHTARLPLHLRLGKGTSPSGHSPTTSGPPENGSPLRPQIAAAHSPPLKVRRDTPPCIHAARSEDFCNPALSSQDGGGGARRRRTVDDRAGDEIVAGKAERFRVLDLVLVEEDDPAVIGLLRVEPV